MKRRNMPEVRRCESGALAVTRMPSEHDLGPVEGFAHRVEDLFRHDHHDAPQPAAAPPIPHNVTQEVPPMSFIAEAEADARALAAKLSAVDHAALDALERVQANPATAEAFGVLGQMTHLPPALLATSVDVLRMTLGVANANAQAEANVPPAVPQPAGPVVAGQA